MKLNRGHKGILLIAAAFVAGVLFFKAPQRSHFPELPNPNGYDVLVREAARITRNPSSLKEMTSNQLAELVATNEAVVREIRKALLLPSVVPVQMSEEWITSQMTNNINLRAAAKAMDAEASSSRQRGDHTNAMALYRDQVQLGHSMMRGGLLINFLIGSATETWAVRRMTNALSELNSEQCKHAARFLDEIDSQRDSFEEITARELEWQRRTYSVFVRLKEGFKKHVLRQSDPFAAIGKALAGDPEMEYSLRTLEVRLLLLKLAARAHELETGNRPQKAAQLVPNYLRHVPRDPATGAELELP